jgi:hypothetical protein
MADEQAADRDWHTRAIVRVKETVTKRSVDPYREHTFHAGEELEMIQWGRAGRPVRRDSWWTSYDIDGALIIEAGSVEIVKIVDETLPWDEPTLTRCKYCGQMHQADLVEQCPLKPSSKIAQYNAEMDERNRIARENIDKPWLPLHDGE